MLMIQQQQDSEAVNASVRRLFQPVNTTPDIVRKTSYDYTENHVQDWFPNVPSYQIV